MSVIFCYLPHGNEFVPITHLEYNQHFMCRYSVCSTNVSFQACSLNWMWWDKKTVMWIQNAKTCYSIVHSSLPALNNKHTAEQMILKGHILWIKKTNKLSIWICLTNSSLKELIESVYWKKCLLQKKQLSHHSSDVTEVAIDLLMYFWVKQISDKFRGLGSLRLIGRELTVDWLTRLSKQG